MSTFTGKRKWGLIVALVMTLLMLGGCSSKQDRIVGIWQRHDSSMNDGLEVKVEKLNDGTYRGAIYKTPPNSLFEIGDVKWNNIKYTTENGYDLEDLSNTHVSFKMHGEITKDDKLNTDSIHLRDLVDTGVQGSTQTWIKVKE